MGFLLIDKPSGWTSFDVVNKIRGVTRIKKVGHAGTLDPFATGLLIVLLGDYTKKQTEFMKMNKTYEVEAILGKHSSTGDPEGDISTINDKIPSEDEILKVLNQFLGEQMQNPPIYSAIKINGKKAYELARKGKEVSLRPRNINILDINLIEYSYPEIKFVCDVSSGTYIRSLVEDIGNNLSTGAYTLNLNRTKIGEYSLDDAIKVQKVTSDIEYLYL